MRSSLTKANTKAASFNWKKWLLILIFMLLAIPLISLIYKQIIRQVAKIKEVQNDVQKEQAFIENQNPIIAANKADKITTNKGVQKAAKDLAHHLGTKYKYTNHWYSIFNPRGWTENDKAAADILLYQRNNYKLLQRLYFEIYTYSRDLSTDIRELLDDDQKKRLVGKLNY